MLTSIISEISNWLGNVPMQPNGLRYLRVGGRGQNFQSRIPLGCREMSEKATDWASELPASIAQPKRIGAWHPTRQVLA
jgi:hypothetical protein